MKTELILLSLVVLLASCVNNETTEKGVEESSEEIAEKFSPEIIYNELKRRSDSAEQISDTIPKPILNELQRMSTDSLYKAYDRYQKANYGKDDRFNYYEVSAEAQKNAEKVFCLILKSKLRLINDSTYLIIQTGTLGDVKGLCDDQNFVHEPVAAFCSGFAVSENRVVTAGHCVLKNPSLKDYMIVYDYRMNSKMVANLNINAKSVFEIEKVLNPGTLRTQDDVAVLQVKGSIPKDRLPVLSTKNNLQIGQPIYAVGYPNGLPVKIAVQAVVVKNQKESYYLTNLDTYAGNSGSPVFNMQDHSIEGVLVRGNRDFTFVKLTNCYASIQCPETIGTCQGEDVTRIIRIKRIINNPK